jgi:hypothetical protein
MTGPVMPGRPWFVRCGGLADLVILALGAAASVLNNYRDIPPDGLCSATSAGFLRIGARSWERRSRIAL